MTYSTGDVVTQTFSSQEVSDRYWAAERVRLRALGFETFEIYPSEKAARRFRLEGISAS